MTKYRASKQIREDMSRIKVLLGEKGYLIFLPISRLRRSPHDFVATSKLGDNLLLVRVGHGRIEIRRSYLYSFTKLLFKNIRKNPHIKTPIRLRHLLLIEKNNKVRASSADEWVRWIHPKQRD
jgi:hypothetical protein